METGRARWLLVAREPPPQLARLGGQLPARSGVARQGSRRARHARLRQEVQALLRWPGL